MVVPGIGLVHADRRAVAGSRAVRPGPDAGRHSSPTTWLPFGGGNRRCLGADFAMAEMRVVLGEVLRRVELSTTTAGDERQRVKHVILVPHRGARICVRAIRDVAATASTPAQAPESPSLTAARSDSVAIFGIPAGRGCRHPPANRVDSARSSSYA